MLRDKITIEIIMMIGGITTSIITTIISGTTMRIEHGICTGSNGIGRMKSGTAPAKHNSKRIGTGGIAIPMRC